MTDTVAQRNAETIKAIYAAFKSQDMPTILGHLDDNVKWNVWPEGLTSSAQAAGVPWLQPFKGRDNVATFFKIMGEQKVTKFEVVSVIASGNSGVSRVVINSTTATGGAANFETLHLWEFTPSGKVAMSRDYSDTDKAIRAWRGENTV